MSKYNKAISNMLYNNTIISDISICEIISTFSSNNLKYYLFCKYKKYFIPKSPSTYSKQHNFTFDDMALYFNYIMKKLNKRHPLIHFEKTNDIITLYVGQDYSITFKIMNNKLYLHNKLNQYTIEWVYSDPYMLFDLYLNKVFHENPNELYAHDILFEYC